MIHVHEKALSVNKAWLGSKKKTKEYRVYEVNVSRQLPDIEIPEGKLQLRMNVYYSNTRADIDNCLKPFIDILQARYGFNDCRIYKIEVEKYVVAKGEERMEFTLEEYDG